MNQPTEMYRRINSAVSAIKIAFGELHDICPYTENVGVDNVVVECKHPSSDYIFPECLIEDCPLLNDTAKTLEAVKNDSAAVSRETKTGESAQ